METTLSNKLGQDSAAGSTTTSQQLSDSVLFDGEPMSLQPSELGLEESVPSQKLQDPLPVDKMETSLSNKLGQDVDAGSTTISQQISESVLFDGETMSLPPSKFGLEESVKQQETLPVDEMETALSNKLVQDAVALLTTISQQISESVLFHGETMTLQLSELGLEESVPSQKQQEPLPVDKLETALSIKLVQNADAGSTTTSQKISESVLFDSETMTLQPSEFGLEESVASLEQQEPLPVDKMETALTNKIVQAAAAGSTTISQQVSESVLFDDETMSLQPSKLGLEESVESLKQQGPLPVDKSETALSNKLVQAAAGGSTSTVHQISESLLFDNETMALQPSKLGLEESVASLKQQEPPPVDKTETALSNKIVQAAAEGSITISQQISESLLLVNEIKPPPLPKLGLEESVESLKQQGPLPVDKSETALSNKLVQAAAGGSTSTVHQISESLLFDNETMALQPSKLGLEESVASLKQQEPPPVDKTETALSNKIVQAAAEGSITISQQISESLLLVNEIKPPPLPKLGLEESVASLKQQERPPVDKMETPLSNTLVQASAGGSTMTSQQISESLLLDIEIITLRLSKLGLEESVASLKQLEPPPQLQHPSLVSLKRRAIGESSYPIIPLKQPNQDTHPSPFKITGISSLDTAVRPLKKRLLLTWPVEESLEKSSSLQPLHCHSSTEAELASPLKFNLTMEVPKKRRTPKSTNKFEREAAHKRQQRLPISSSYKKPVAEMMAAPLQQPEVNLEKKEKNAQMLDMVFHSAEMEENEKTMLLSISSLAKRFDGNKGMRTAAMQMMSGSAPKEGNVVVGKSVEEMHVKMPVLQKDEKQPVSRKGKEKAVAEESIEELHVKMEENTKTMLLSVSSLAKRFDGNKGMRTAAMQMMSGSAPKEGNAVVGKSVEEMHVKMPVLQKDEKQPVSRKGKEKVVAEIIEELHVKMEENAKTMSLSISSLAKRFDGNKGMRTAAMQMMSGSAPKEGNAVVGKSVEEMHVKMPVLQKDEKQPVSRKGKEKVVAESIEELHVKMPVLEEDENQPLSRKGKEKVVAKSIEEIDVFEENDDPPFIIAGDVHQPKLKVYNLRKRKPNQIPRAANPTDVETAVTKVTAEMKEKPKRLRNKKKRKEEVPKFTARFVFPLTAKEIAEDLLSMTATKPSRQKIRRPAELQKEIDKLCPTKVKFKISPDDY